MEPKCFRMSDKKYAVVRHFFETTTIHGLPQVWSSETKCQKLIFFVAFLLCNGLSLYYCYKIVTQFVETPVATSYFVQEAEALRVPDITICPFTRFNYDFLHTHNVSDELIGYAELAFFDFTPTYDFVDLQKLIDQHKKERYQMERKLNSLLHRLNLTFEKFVDSASTHCSDVILYCVQGAQGHRYHNCCDQATTVITTMGKCFRIPGTMQSGGGFTQGMFVMLKLPLSPSSLPTSNAQMNDGVLVKLTEPGKGLDFDATMVPTGVHSLFQLRAVSY